MALPVFLKKTTAGEQNEQVKVQTYEQVQECEQVQEYEQVQVLTFSAWNS